jgi:hypothetical protein
MSTSFSPSAFISPPLPGHLIADNKRDRSTDADLKRDINVNSLILNASNFIDDDTTTLIAKTEYHIHEPENDLIMMTMPSDYNRYQKKDKLVDKNENNSLDRSNVFKNKFPKNEKNKKVLDVLKAADGDIIFGNNFHVDINKTNELSDSFKKVNKTVEGSIASTASRKLFNNNKSTREPDENLLKKKIFTCNNSLNAINKKTIKKEPKDEKKYTTELKSKTDIKIPKKNSSTIKSNLIEYKPKKSKKVKQNYLSPLKNVLKTKHRKFYQGKSCQSGKI